MKKKRRQRHRVVIDFCAECGTLLPAGSYLCPICDWDNREIPLGDGQMMNTIYNEILNDPDFEDWYSA